MNQTVCKQMRYHAEYEVPMRGASRAEAQTVLHERKRLARAYRKEWNALPWRQRRREKRDG